MASHGWKTGPILGERAERRDSVELAMMLIARAMMDADELELRMRQALRRGTMIEAVLEPGILRVDELRIALKKAQAALRGVWLDGQAGRWFDDGSS